VGGDWWSATEGGSGLAWYRGMGSGSEFVDEHYYVEGLGLSVLCLQD
jgi:hypothetical protein